MINKSAVVLFPLIWLLVLSATVFSQNALSPRLDSTEAWILREGLRSSADTTSGNQITGQLLRDCINQAQVDVVTMWPEAAQKRWTGVLNGDCGCFGLDSTFLTIRSVIIVSDTGENREWRPLKFGDVSVLRDSSQEGAVPQTQVRNIEWYFLHNDTVFVHPLFQGSSNNDSIIVFGFIHPLPLSAGANTTLIRDEYRSILRHRAAQYTWEAVHEWAKAATHQKHWDAETGKQTKTTVTQEKVQ